MAKARIPAGGRRCATCAPSHPPRSEATAIRAAISKSTFPESANSSTPVPLLSSAKSTLSAFACCMLDGKRMPIAASIRIPIPAPK